MSNIDSLTKFEIKAHLDSLDNFYKTQIDSLSLEINQEKICVEYFHDILSHQWTLLSIQTGIFVFIVVFVLAILGLISWKYFFKKILDANKQLRNRQSELEKNLNNMPNIAKDLNETTNLALRVAYESATK